MESQKKDLEDRREKEMNEMKAKIEDLQMEKKERIKIYDIGHKYANEIIDRKDKENKCLVQWI